MKTEIYCKMGEVVTRNIAGETLLVPIKGRLADMQNLFFLEGSGEFIWSCIDGSRSVADICEALVCEFDIGPEQAECDVSAFVQSLLSASLIELNPRQSTGSSVS